MIDSPRITFDTDGCLRVNTFTSGVRTKLFQMIWSWFESFERCICNDENIIITNIYVRKELGKNFANNFSITIIGTAYGFPVNEKIYFDINDITKRNPKEVFGKNFTQRFAEVLGRIQMSIYKHKTTIDKTMDNLQPR